MDLSYLWKYRQKTSVICATFYSKVTHIKIKIKVVGSRHPSLSDLVFLGF